MWSIQPGNDTGPARAERRARLGGLTVGAPVRITRPGMGFNYPPVSNERWITERTYAGPGGAKPLGRVDRLARYLLQRDVTTHVRHGSSWQPTPRQRRRLDHKARHAAAPFKPRIVTAADMAPAFMAEFWAQRPDTSVMVAAETLAAMDTRGPAASAVIVDEPTICAESATIGGRVEVCTNPQGHTGAHHDLGSGQTWPPTVAPWNEPARVGVAPPVMQQNPPERERSAMNRGFRVVDRRGEHRS